MATRGAEGARRSLGVHAARGGLLVGTLLVLSSIFAAGAAAAPPQLWQTPAGAFGGAARGLAADPDNGHVFVSDQIGRRIVELTAWGELVRAWGWDVVASGPGNKSTAPEPPQFEICVPAEGDECKGGVQGNAGAGQFNSAAGVALDSAGNVYAAEAGAPRRVQKFSPEGAFLLSFGGGVNQGGGTPESPGDVCTKEHLENGDACGAGETGTGPGEFSGATGALRTVIAIAPDDKVWVGDKDRIQLFNTEGEYQGQCNTPGKQAQQVAVDSGGSLYVSFEASTNDAEPDVFKINPLTCEQLTSPVFKAGNPRAIALAPNGDVYVFDQSIAQIRRFDSSGNEAEPPFGAGASTGLTANDITCGEGGIAIYHSNESPGFVRAYSPVPDKACAGDPPKLPPQITRSHARSVGTTDAVVGAEISPVFWEDGAYRVQYGSESCLEGAEAWGGPCVQEALAPGAPLTPGGEVTDEFLPVSAALSGLAPGTTYRFRFVAESSGGGPAFGPDTTFTTYLPPEPNTDCPNQDLRSGPSAHLPDCRAYELVSPEDKNGGEITAYYYEGFEDNGGFAGRDQATPGGNKLTYTASTAFADPEGSPFVKQFLATRTAGGWRSESIDPRSKGGNVKSPPELRIQFEAFSSDLCFGWVLPESGLDLVAGPTEGFKNLYRRSNCATPPAFTWLESSSPDPLGHVLLPELQGAAQDGSFAVFRVNDALVPEAPSLPESELGSAWQLYGWWEGTGVRLVSVLPDGTALEGNSTAGTERDTVASQQTSSLDTVERAASEDGETIYWSDPAKPGMEEPFEGAGPGTLYVRVNASAPQSEGAGCEPAKACTLPVAGLVAGWDPSSEALLTTRARFWTATPDGGRAIFSVQFGGAFSILYEYDLASETVTPITGSALGGSQLGVAGAAEDLSRVYLASEEVCSGAKENSEEDAAQAGEPNLYLYQPGESCKGGEMDFVGTLSAEEDLLTGGGEFAPPPGPLSPVPRSHVARVSPDGGHLAFVSAAQLTAYDNADAISGEPDREVYLYDAGAGELSCASCNPTGSRPRGARLGLEQHWTAAWIPGYQGQLYGRRPLSEDGNRLFFNSVDSLALRDVNGAQDVYQWEAPGTGDCSIESTDYVAQNEGCVSLISSGQSARDAEFVEASADGSDVFFRTEAGLVGSDPGQVDIYDARVGGGFPEPSEAEACEGDACQSPGPPPEFPSPASSAFRDPGNPVAVVNCTRRARQAAGLSRRAKRARRAARRASAPAKAKRMGRRAARNAKRAKGLSRSAKRCRRANRRRAAR